jgi:hypothetical protein
VAAQEPVLAASTVLSEELGPVCKPTYGHAIVACGNSLAKKASAGLLRGYLDGHL